MFSIKLNAVFMWMHDKNVNLPHAQVTVNKFSLFTKSFPRNITQLFLKNIQKFVNFPEKKIKWDKKESLCSEFSTYDKRNKAHFRCFFKQQQVNWSARVCDACLSFPLIYNHRLSLLSQWWNAFVSWYLSVADAMMTSKSVEMLCAKIYSR